MKVNAVITKPDFLSDKTQKSTIASAVIIASGIIVGTLLYVFCGDKLSVDLIEYFINFTTDFSHKNKPEIFFGLILQNIIYYILMLIFATSFIGTPIVCFISFVKTMGLGVLVSYIYQSFALKGIEYCLLVFFPGKFFLILAMLLMTQNSKNMALNIFKSANNFESSRVDLNKFLIRSIIILIIILLSSSIDFIAIISFSSLFDFT